MIGSIVSRIPQRSIHAIDMLVLAWTIVWIAVGVTVGTFVSRLGAVGDGLQDTGRAIVRAGDAVGQLAEVPLVGEGFESVAAQIGDLGRETQQDGRSLEDDVDRLAWLIGASLGLAPTIPILVAWVPPRVSRERERRALRRSLRARDGAALGYLAHRAVATRGFRELLAVSDDPVRDLAARRYDALASLELDHLALGGRRWLASRVAERDAPTPEPRPARGERG